MQYRSGLPAAGCCFRSCFAICATIRVPDPGRCYFWSRSIEVDTTTSHWRTCCHSLVLLLCRRSCIGIVIRRRRGIGPRDTHPRPPAKYIRSCRRISFRSAHLVNTSRRRALPASWNFLLYGFALSFFLSIRHHGRSRWWPSPQKSHQVKKRVPDMQEETYPM